MSVAQEYVELGLRLGRHVDGLVDAYYGDPAVKVRIDAEPLRAPAALVADAARLLEGLDGDEQRARWLRAQLVGLETVARKLAGEELEFADEVERCYGIRPRRTAETEQCDGRPGSRNSGSPWSSGLQYGASVSVPSDTIS